MAEIIRVRAENADKVRQILTADKAGILAEDEATGAARRFPWVRFVVKSGAASRVRLATLDIPFTWEVND